MTRPADSTIGNPADATRVILGSLAAAMIGGILTNILPLYLGALSDTKKLDSQQLGILASAFFLGFNISGLSAFAWVRKLHWRNASLATLPVSLGAFAWSAYSQSSLSLITATLIAGASLGVIYTIGTVVIGDTSNSSRWYGVKMAVEAAGGMVLIFILPTTLIPRFGFLGLVGGIAIYCIVLLPLLLLLPRCWQNAMPKLPGLKAAQVQQVTDGLAIGMTIFALFTFCVGNAAIWTFAERLGKLAGYSDSAVESMLVATLASGVGGALIVAAIGNRFGSAKCFGAVAIIGIVGMMLLNTKSSFLFFVLGNCMCSASWVAGSSFAMGETAELDKDGRFVALVVPAIGLGSMVGPSITGWLLNIATTSTALIFSGFCVGVSILAMLLAKRSFVTKSLNAIAQ